MNDQPVTSRRRRRALWGAAGLLALVSACSSASSNGGSGADAGPGGGPADAGGAPADGGATSSDAGADGASAEAGAVDLSCLGAEVTMTQNHGLPYASVGVGSPAVTGQFLLDLATTRSRIDLAALPGESAQATGCNPALLGQACMFPAFSFFNAWGAVTLTTDDESYISGLRQAGIVGTDFTSTVAFTLDYASGTIRKATPGALCTDATLTQAGFVALSVGGFFAKDTTKLRPMTDVVSTAAAGVRVPNVPTAPLRVAGATAPAQLDTGFADSVGLGSVNINKAFYDAIVLASPTALVRDAAKDLVLTTCLGGTENVTAYDLAPGTSVALVDAFAHDTGKTTAATIFVKNTPAAASSCGGIGTWTAPGAQVGASFFAGRAWLFDPDSSRVWVR